MPLKKSVFFMIFMIFGVILNLPAAAQTLQTQLHEELRKAIKDGDKQKVLQLNEQLRGQLMPMSLRNRAPKRPWVVSDPQVVALHQQLQDANKSGDKQKADQIRAQLNSLYKQHFAQIKQLHNKMRAAFQRGDQQEARQLRDQLMDMKP